MRKKIVMAITLALTVAFAGGCTSTSTSTTEVNLSATTDEGTKDYSFKEENNNGDITTEESYVETPTADTESTGTDESSDDPVKDAAVFIDGEVGSLWGNDGRGRRVTLDPDEIYVQVWSDDITSVDDLDEDAIRNDVIPSWMDAVESWRSELDSRGLNDVEICLQYISANTDEELVFFTIEGGELTYLAFED